MIIYLKNKHTLKVGEFLLDCCIGKGGISYKKIEGDKKTPAGIFSLGPLFYRKDRKLKPNTKLKRIVIKKNMGWCNDINSKKYKKKNICISGVISTFNEKPQIQIDFENQIEIRQ